MTYETPAITELGSVADFTRADSPAWDHDGHIFSEDRKGGGGSGPHTS